MRSIATVAATIIASAYQSPRSTSTVAAHTVRALTRPSRTSLMTSPTVPEKAAMTRESGDVLNGARAAWVLTGVLVASRRGGTPGPCGPGVRCHVWLDQPILLAIARAADWKAIFACVAPGPLVALTQARPKSFQTDDICGMFGIGTPPLPAAPKAASTGSCTCLPAVVLAGKRPLASARLSWAAGLVM